MTTTTIFDNGLIDRLPPVHGRYAENVDLSRVTWFRVGGPAEVVFRPRDMDDLATFLIAKPANVPVTVLGVGSNLLVRDGGVPGVAIRLGRHFARISVVGEDRIAAGAGALDLNVARAALEAGLGGLEFLSGIPGVIGGALRMNAGAYGTEMADIVVSARAMDPNGVVHDFTADRMRYDYRHCGLPGNLIFLDAILQGLPRDIAAIADRMRQIAAERDQSQPARSRTGGSTFANPKGAKAWELIEQAGCRGLKRGGARVSERHCNFLINAGGATATDLEGLGEEVRRRVLNETGVELRWEIRRLGVSLGGLGNVGGTEANS